MRKFWTLSFLAAVAMGSVPAKAVEVLLNGGFEQSSVVFPGWTLQEFYTGSADNADTASLASFADYNGEPNESGLFLHPWAGGTGVPVKLSNAILTQTVPGVAGETYNFTGYSSWETNYAGGVTTLSPTSPLGATASPTKTEMDLEFLNAANVVIGVKSLDLRTEQVNGTGWKQHLVSAEAPAGTTQIRVSAKMLDGVVNKDPQQSAFFDNFSLYPSSDINNDLLGLTGLLDEPEQTIINNWTLTQNPEGRVTAELQGFAQDSNSSGSQGIWLRAFEGTTANPVDAILSQSVPGTAGENYTFSIASRWEQNYAGGVSILASGTPSPTQTLMELAFLDGSDAVIGTPVSLDLRTVQTNDGNWHNHSINGIAPAGTSKVRVSALALSMVANKDPGQSAFWDTASLIAGPRFACDLNNDGGVDAADAGIMFGNWAGSGVGDCNHDGIVDAADAGVMFGEWTGDPTTPNANAATAEYNSATGELKISSAGAVNVFVQSAGSHITPLNPAPTVPVGLLTNNASRVGITNLGPINVTNFSFGNIGVGLAESDLKLVYTPALGQKGIEIAAGAAGFRYIPEPGSLGLLGLGIAGVLVGRRR